MKPIHAKYLFVLALMVTGMAVHGAASDAQATYASADQAGAALVQALQSRDEKALAKVLGNDWRDYIPTEGIDQQDVDAFVAFYGQHHAIVEEKGKSHIEVGSEGWTLPIPVVQGEKGWSFDVREGRQEMIARHVEANEWGVIQAMLAYYDAQREYAAKDRDGDSVLQYASRLISSPGKHDGLYWPAKGDDAQSPLGPYFVSPPEGDEFLGYHYRILTAQGPSAPGGAYSYVSGGRMTNGFALVAWPARYGQSGVMTFTVSHDGLVFQKDLGKDTPRTVAAMKLFDPDSSWSEVRTEY